MMYEVQIIGSNKRARRVIYGNKDISGPGITSDPIVAAAVKEWGLNGSPDNATIEISLTGKLKVDQKDEQEPSSSHLEGEPVTVVADDIKHTGGGWYILPSGRKVKGKQAALDALSAE